MNEDERWKRRGWGCGRRGEGRRTTTTPRRMMRMRGKRASKGPVGLGGVLASGRIYRSPRQKLVRESRAPALDVFVYQDASDLAFTRAFPQTIRRWHWARTALLRGQTQDNSLSDEGGGGAHGRSRIEVPMAPRPWIPYPRYPYPMPPPYGLGEGERSHGQDYGGGLG